MLQIKDKLLSIEHKLLMRDFFFLFVHDVSEESQ